MNGYKYILEPYKGMNTRYHCPNCQQRDKTFSLYIDAKTGEHIHPNVGRCNRESNCGYHYTPKQYFQDNNISSDIFLPKAEKPKTLSIQPKSVSFIPDEVFKASLNLTAFETNHFIQYLSNLFGIEVTNKLVGDYFIATSKHWNGASVFWQIDTQGKSRTGKIMLYNPATGKRVKEPFNHINWVHNVLKQPVFELKQCLFGEHLLIDKTKPVAIVESEKTAVIASVYLPQYIWLAVGSLTNLNSKFCNILSGRTVVLFPDLNGFDKWSIRLKELSHIALFIISDLLELNATESERKQGFDIADYLVKYNYKEFVLPEIEAIESTPTAPIMKGLTILEDSKQVNHFNKSEQLITESWDQTITEFENYFSEISISNLPVFLNPYSTITNIPLFVDSHLTTLKANKGNRTFKVFINRLNELKQLLQSIEQ
jgi:hypothetical protein